MEAAASMMSFGAKPHANVGEDLDARIGSWAGKRGLLLSSMSSSSSEKRRRWRVHCIRAVASDFSKVNSRPNQTKVEAGSKLLDGKLESSIGAVAATMSKEALVSPISPDAGGHLDAAIDAALLGKLQKEEVKTEKRQIPLDALGRGRFVENRFVYRQTFVIRSYEVGFDKTASIETLTNLFQETALNHVGMCEFVGDGMGTTHAMMKNRLIWIVTRMHIQVTRYPVWGDVVEIDSWVSGSGKNGMRRDFLVRDYSTGQILARATSNWAMMNQDIRRLSKMPEAVRAEISPFFLDRSVMEEDDSCGRIPILDDTAPYIKAGLVPKLHDMDMNQHVNHVKYIDWVLESVPQALLVSNELKSMTLEYRRECGPAEVVTSLSRAESPLPPSCCCSIHDHPQRTQQPPQQQEPTPHRPLASHQASDQEDDHHLETAAAAHFSLLQFTHLLRLESTGAEVLRGRTEWRPKAR